MKKRVRYEACTRAGLGGSAGILGVNRTWDLPGLVLEMPRLTGAPIRAAGEDESLASTLLNLGPPFTCQE